MFCLKKERLLIATILALLFAIVQPVVQANPQSAIAQTESGSLGKITVASDNDPILRLLTELSVLALENAGYEVDYRKDIGYSSYELDYLPNIEASQLSTSSEIGAHPSLHKSTIDYHWTYPQRSLVEHLKVDGSLIPNDSKKAWELAYATDKRYTQLAWLAPTEFFDAYSLLVRPGAVSENLESIQDLADMLNQGNDELRLCVDQEFFDDEDGLQALQEQYRFAFTPENISIIEFEKLYDALKADQCDLSLGRTIDWQIEAFDLQILTDSEDFFPQYSPAPIFLDTVLAQNPELDELFSSITSVLDTKTMAALNARLNVGADGISDSGDEESIEEVARSFLVEKRLLPKPDIVVGSQNYTEQLILGQMLLLLLEDAGYNAIDKTGFGDAEAVRAAMLDNEIDVAIDLTGSALTTYHNLPSTAIPADPVRAFELAHGLDATNGITWLGLGAFNNSRILMVRQDFVQEGIETIDDLAESINAGTIEPRICIESIFYSQNPDGFDSLQELYGFQFDEKLVELMDTDSAYDGLRTGDCDIALGRNTDGRRRAWGFATLEDTRLFFPPNNPVFVVRRPVLDANPELQDLLIPITSHLDDVTMSMLNARVDLGADSIPGNGDEESPKAVAESFLQQERLLRLPTLSVGAKDTSEQYLLGQMLILFLEGAGYEVIDKTRFGDSQSVRDAMLNDQIDVMIDLTGDALATYHHLPSTATPYDHARTFELARSLDRANGIEWLSFGDFDSTRTLLVRDTLVEEGIETIDDLANYIDNGNTELRICIEADFFSDSRDGFDAMQEMYGLHFTDEYVELMDLDSVYDGLRSGECDVAQGNNTDGRGKAWGFTNLTDTRSFFAHNNPSPVVRSEILVVIPELAERLTTFVSYLDDDTMRDLNARMAIGADGIFDNGDEESPVDVARDFLNSINNVDSESKPTHAEGTEQQIPDDSPSDSSDGSTENGSETSEEASTESIENAQPLRVITNISGTLEQKLMGEMLVFIVDSISTEGTYEVIIDDALGEGGSEEIHAALESGAIDFYVGMTSHTLETIYGLPKATLPTEPERSLRLIQRLDEPKKIVWLAAADANIRPALVVQADLAEEGILTIEDLADRTHDPDLLLTLCIEERVLESIPFGLEQLQQHYDMAFLPENILVLDADNLYAALRDGRCDVIQGINTDGRIAAWDLVALEDTLSFFPATVPAPVMQSAFLDKNPDLVSSLEALREQLTNSRFRELSAQITVGADGTIDSGDEISIHDAAQLFLCDRGIIAECAAVDIPAQNPTTTELESTNTDGEAADADAEVAEAKSETNPTTPILANPLLPTRSDRAETLEITIPDEYGVNARFTANTESTVVEVLARGSTATAIGRLVDNSWLQIELPDQRLVWVFADAIFYEQGKVDSLPIVTPPQLATSP